MRFTSFVLVFSASLTHDFAKPADLGNVVAFLASEKSYQIIGAVIDVTGGTLC